MAAVLGVKPATPAGSARPVAPAGHGRPARRLSRPPRLPPATPLQMALVASATAHAVLLGVQFVRAERPDRTPHAAPLEVVLVNTRSAEKPAAARVVAQASLAGGGNAESGLAASPLPPAPQERPGNDELDLPEQREARRAHQAEMLARVQREPTALPQPAPQPEEDGGSAETRAAEARQREMLDLLAALDRRLDERTAGHRRRYIAPAAVEAVYAPYYDRLRRRIEEEGTRDFPQLQGRKLYGELTMNLVVDAEGRVVETEIVRASSQRQLDRHAIAIVKAAAPFGPFTPAMRRQADELVVTARFRFTRDDGLETTLAGPR